MAVGYAVIKIYIVCVINKYVLKIPLLICVNGRSKSYVCLQLSLEEMLQICVDVRLVTESHEFQTRVVPECSSACTRPRSCSAAPGAGNQGGTSQLQRCHGFPSTSVGSAFSWCQHTSKWNAGAGNVKHYFYKQLLW